MISASPVNTAAIKASSYGNDDDDDKLKKKITFLKKQEEDVEKVSEIDGKIFYLQCW